MKQSENDYHISFFKPTTGRARFNRDLVIWLASIWFVAIFGFHIALRVLEKPVPEPALVNFQDAWTGISSGEPTDNDLRNLGASTLSVLGKIMITPEERAALSNAMSWAVIQLIPESQTTEMVNEIKEFVALKSNITNINDPNYRSYKDRISSLYSPVLGLDRLDARTIILPIELTYTETLDNQYKSALPGIMEKYLIHNRSALTDFVFLGFPFHYFYSAVFLLILFVGLCWLYCYRSDRRNAILGIED